jgi:hypothetical protein
MRIWAAAATFVAALGCGAGSSPAFAADPGVPDSQALVVLLSDHVARTRPSVRAHRIESVSAQRPLTRVRTRLPVIASRKSGGRTWLHVRLPGRPSGHKGWIPADRTRLATTEWHITLRLATRRVVVYHNGKVARRFRAVVGAPSTPTPIGRFFVEESMSLSAPHGGPYALATSARSAVLQEFEGGPGQIALHGTQNLPGALGSAASHGCIRLSTAAITWLALRVRAGVPLTIRR